MKKASIISLLAFITIMYYSCKPNPERIIKKNIKEFLNNSVDEPKSYEFVSLTPIDTITYKDIIELRKDEIKKIIEEEKNKKKSYEEYKKWEKDNLKKHKENTQPGKRKPYYERIKELEEFLYGDSYEPSYEEIIENYNEMIKRYEKIINSYDSLIYNMGEKVTNVVYYNYLFKYRYNRKKII